MVLGALSSASVVQFCWAMAWGAPRSARGLQLASFLLLEGAMVALYGVWLPRIVRRRHAAERARDPVGAPRRQAREHLWGRVGLALGTGIGALGFLQGFLRG